MSTSFANQQEYYAKLHTADIGSIARELLSGRITKETASRLECDCPHHNSRSKTSFHVNLDSRAFYCFGCQVGGDVLQLVEFVHTGSVTKGIRGEMPQSHRDARDWVAAKLGMPPLHQLGLSLEEIKEWERKQAEADRVFGVLTDYAVFCHEKAKESAELDAIRQKYGLSQEIIESQRIGYSDNYGVIDYLYDLGYSNKELVASGLFRRDSFSYNTNTGEYYVSPYFVNRWTFPYWDNGRVIYLIGRETPNTPEYGSKNEKSAKKGGKYQKLPVFSPERYPGISKSIDNSVLFNEHTLNSRPKFVIITEGVTDCLSSIDHGFPSFSPITVSIKKEDLERILPKLRGVTCYICFDNEVNKVGEEGALRVAADLERQGIEARIITLPLTDEQAVARTEIEEKFGISRAMDKAAVADASKKIPDDQKQKYEDLCAKSKQDVNSFFLTFSTEDFQKRIDEAPTRLGIVIQARISMIEAKDRNILNDDVFFSTLNLCKQSDMALFDKIMDLAKKKKWTQRFTEKMKQVQAANRSTSKYDDIPELTTFKEALEPLGISLPEEYEEFVLPAYYFLTENGYVEYQKETSTGFKKELVYPDPILVVREQEEVNVQGFMIELKYFCQKTRIWKTVTVNKEIAVNSRQAVKLAGMGMNLASKNAEAFANYIHEFTIANRKWIRSDRASNQLGWMSLKSESPSFLYGGSCIGDPSICFTPQNAGDSHLKKCLRPQGSMETWLSLAEKIITKYPKLAIFFYAALASPLLEILDQKTFIVDLAAPTSSGKSIALRFVLSAWGDPNKLIRSWNSTAVGLEWTACTLKDFPLALDDTKLGNVQKFAIAVYQLTDDKGKLRGAKYGGPATILYWKCAVLTTGEASLSCYISDAGGRARVFPITGYPFGDTNHRDLVTEIDRISNTNYGHIAPAWIQFLLDNRGRWAEWKEEFYDRLQKTTTASGIEGRFANVQTIITLTAELLHESGILPWEFVDPFPSMTSDLQNSVTEADIGKRSLRDLYEWIQQHEETFWGRHKTHSRQIDGQWIEDPVEPQMGWSGRWSNAQLWNQIGIFPTRAKEVLTRLGYDPEACVAAWKANGQLVCDRDNNTTKHLRIGKDQKGVRFLVFSHKVLERAAGLDCEDGEMGRDPDKGRKDNVIDFKKRVPLDKMNEKYQEAVPANDDEDYDYGV